MPVHIQKGNHKPLRDGKANTIGWPFLFFQATIIFHLTTIIYFLSRVKYTHRNPGTWHHPIMASRSKSKISPSISGPARLPGDISSGTTPLILGTYTTKRQFFCPPHTQNTLVRQDDHSRYSYSRCKIGGGGESLFDGSSEIELAHHRSPWSRVCTHSRVGSMAAPWVWNHPAHFFGRLLALHSGLWAVFWHNLSFPSEMAHFIADWLTVSVCLLPVESWASKGHFFHFNHLCSL